jgi:type II secretory pathway pseudopilin PulG
MLLFKKKEIINERGFTILEAMVTMGIIVIMSAAYVTNYRSTNQQIVLDQATSNLVSDLRLVQNMSMNVKLFNEVIPEGGYGIKIVDGSSTYTIYADCNNASHVYDNSADCGPGLNIQEKVADKTLDPNIDISPTLDISFQPPNPIVWFDGLDTGSSANIFLRYGSNIQGRKITINRLTGQISVSKHDF